MSQSAKQNKNNRTAPTIPFKSHDPKVDDASPDDPIGVSPPDPKPGGQPAPCPEG